MNLVQFKNNELAKTPHSAKCLFTSSKINSMAGRLGFLTVITAAAVFLSPFTASSASAEGLGALNQSLKSGAQLQDTAAGETAIGRVTARYKLNVRRSPYGEIIDGFAPGKLVEVIAREGDWYRIRYGTGEAYVHTTLIAVESGTPRVTQSAFTLPTSGTVTAEHQLNVRRSAWGAVIDGLKPGTKVAVIGYEGEWYIIRHKGGTAYVHNELVALDRIADADQKVIQSETAAKPSESEDTQYKPENGAADKPSETNNSNNESNIAEKDKDQTDNKEIQAGGINGPYIPAELKKGLEAAKKSKWMASHKCLQFAGTVAHEAGAPGGKTTHTQPQSSYPADTALRGRSIDSLPEAVEAGQLLPGMLVHVKIHYDRDPAYHVSGDAHHWFIYMGKDEQGVPRFADNTRKGNLQSANDVYRNMKGWENSKKYGDAKYGYIPRVTAVHDPFASVR